MASLNPPVRDWTSRTVWIVGASSGIGRALASQLGAKGARVVVSARREDELQTIVPAPFMCLACDIGQPESVDHALSTMHSANAIPDMVLWVAGVYHPMHSADLDFEQVKQTFDINVLSAYYAQAKLVKLWQAQRAHAPNGSTPHWVLVSSVAGYSGLPQASAYGASKAALTYLAEVAYLELGQHGIAVSVVNPGFVDTRLTQKNDFKMPSIISTDEAAQETIRGIEKGQFEIHYPRRFTRWLKLLRILPYSLYFKIIRTTLPRPPTT